MDDAVWLKRISDKRISGLESAGHVDVNRFTRFLDTHFVLYLRNGEEWYDIHPLIREDVKYIAKVAESETVSAPSTPENA